MSYTSATLKKQKDFTTSLLLQHVTKGDDDPLELEEHDFQLRDVAEGRQQHVMIQLLRSHTLKTGTAV